MAATFTVLGTALAWVANKNMLSIYNTSTTLVTKIHRIWMTNPQTGAVTGGLGLAQIGYITTSVVGGPTVLTPVPHDPSKTTVSGVTVTTAGTVPTLSNVLRTVLKANDEIAAATGTIDEMNNVVPLSLIWDAGYGDGNVQPITLRANQGLTIRTITAGVGVGGTYAGTCDIWAEFTHE